MGIKQRIRNFFLPNMVNAFSQEGEDIFLRRIFHDVHDGCYVDVGAHHPSRFSNTFMFYLEGWRGVNIDAAPGSMEPFHKSRPLDKNIECPVGKDGDELEFFIFDEPALNGFSPEISKFRDDETPYKILEKKQLKVKSLERILDECDLEQKKIHFMSIDVEGLELEVLKSNNWTKYRPLIVLAEILDCDLDDAPSSDIYKFMDEKGYRLIGKTFHSYFFAEKDFSYK